MRLCVFLLVRNERGEKREKSHVENVKYIMFSLVTCRKRTTLKSKTFTALFLRCFISSGFVSLPLEGEGVVLFVCLSISLITVTLRLTVWNLDLIQTSSRSQKGHTLRTFTEDAREKVIHLHVNAFHFHQCAAAVLH